MVLLLAMARCACPLEIEVCSTSTERARSSESQRAPRLPIAWLCAVHACPLHCFEPNPRLGRAPHSDWPQRRSPSEKGLTVE
jgi:hypothetical protein